MQVILSFFLALLALNPISKIKPPAQSAVKPSMVTISQERYERTIDALIEKSDDFFHQGEYENSVFMLQMVNELDPGNVEIWSDRAWILWAGLQRDDEAFKVMKEGISYNPKNYQLYFDIAFLHDHRKEYNQSILFYQKAISLGAPWYIRHSLAHAYEKCGQIDKARETWRQALKLNPKDEAAKTNLERLNRGEYSTSQPKSEISPFKREDSQTQNQNNVSKDIHNVK